MFGLLKKTKKAKVYDNDPVACAGKLPFHPEFIRYGVTSPILASLEQWLQLTFSEANRQHDDKALAEIPSYHTILQLKQCKQPIIGSLQPSIDQSGREYPFFIFRILQNPIAQEFQATIPILYQNFFFATKLSSDITSQDQLIAALEKLVLIDATASKRLALENVLDVFKRHQLFTFSCPEDEFAQALQAAIKSIQASIQAKQPWVLRLPLVAKQESVFVTFYCHLLQSVLALKACSYQLFWQASGTKPTMTIISPGLNAKSLKILAKTYSADIAVHDLSSHQARDKTDISLMQALDDWSLAAIGA